MSQFSAAAPVALDNLKQAAWFARLRVAATPRAAATLLVELVEAQDPGAEPNVAWPDRDGAPWLGTSGMVADAVALHLIEAALRAPDGVACVDGMAAMRLSADLRAALLLHVSSADAARALLRGAGARLGLVLERLSAALAGRPLPAAALAAEQLAQRPCVMYALADLAGAGLHGAELWRGVQNLLATVLDAREFLALGRDAATDRVRVLYHCGGTPADRDLAGADVPLARLRGAPAWRVLTEGRLLVGVDAAALLVPDGDEAVPGMPWLGVPWRDGGLTRGALLVRAANEGPAYDGEDGRLLAFAANQIGLALARSGACAALPAATAVAALPGAVVGRDPAVGGARVRGLQNAWLELAWLATTAAHEATFHARAHAVVSGLIDARHYSIALAAGPDAALRTIYGAGASAAADPLGLDAYVRRRAQPVLLQRSDIEALRAAGELGATVAADVVSWLGVPLRHVGAVVGVVAVRSDDGASVYTRADAELLAALAPQIAHGIFQRRTLETLRADNAELERQAARRRHALREQQARCLEAQRQLEYQQQHDRLTALPNHWALRQRMEVALAAVRADPGRACALIHIDIDRFRVINGSLGHIAGDHILRQLAERLRRSVGEDALVTRLFGAEFAILLEAAPAQDQVLAVATQALDAIRAPLPVGAERLSPSASIGIAIARGGHMQPEDLRRSAEIAMRRAKRLGRNRIETFDPSWEPEVRAFLGLEVRLRHGLEEGAFEPYFQPLRRLADGKLVGYEALLRWHHPELGLLQPLDFLDVAERSGLIEAIDWRMFEASFRRLAADGPADAFLSINVSALHLGRDEFAGRLLALVDRVGLARNRIVVEVTEGTLLGDPERVRATLLALRKHGIGAALDDFGTGYSSLSYLHSLPLSLVKIDQTFVRALCGEERRNSRTVVAAIIALAKALDMRVVAEGIETAEQRDLLTAMGCAIGQGYLLGRPQPKKRWRRLYPRVLEGSIGRHLLPLVRTGHGR